MIEISVAYCVIARIARAIGKEDIGWRALAEARYYLGVARGAVGMLDMPTALQARKHRGKVLADIRHAGNRQMKDEAERLYCQHLPGKTWVKRRDAFNIIFPHLAKFIEANGLGEKLLRTDITTGREIDRMKVWGLVEPWFTKVQLKAFATK